MPKPAPKSKLKTYLEDNPLAVLLALALSAGGTVAGVMNYYTSQRMDAAEAEHKVEMASSEAQHKAAMSSLEARSRKELQDATTPLQDKITDLTNRLVSIERRVPGSDPDYLDVTKLTIVSGRVKDLGEKYRPFAGSRFYVDVPDLASWHYEETNQLQLLRTFYGVKADDTESDDFSKALGSERVYIWRSTAELKVEVTRLDSSPMTLTFFPAVIVEDLDADTLRRRATALGRLLIERFSDEKPEKNAATAHALDAATKELREQPPAEETADLKQKVLGALSDVVSSDVATSVLQGVIVDAQQENFVFGGRHRLSSMQKKGNVWYVQDEVTIPSGKPPASDGSAGSDALIVDEEHFFFGYGRGGLWVRVILPRTEAMAKNSAWARSWLVGLRVPLSD
jgi:hypothetical protein